MIMKGGVRLGELRFCTLIFNLSIASFDNYN
jgi:hypothetical protein